MLILNIYRRRRGEIMKLPAGIFFPAGFLPEKRPAWQHPGCLQPSVSTQLAEALQVFVCTHLTHLNTALQKAKGRGAKVRGWWRHCLILYWFFWPGIDSSKPKPKAVRPLPNLSPVLMTCYTADLGWSHSTSKPERLNASPQTVYHLTLPY